MEPWAAGSDIVSDFLFDVYEGDVYPPEFDHRAIGCACVKFHRMVFLLTRTFPDGVLPSSRVP